MRYIVRTAGLPDPVPTDLARPAERDCGDVRIEANRAREPDRPLRLAQHWRNLLPNEQQFLARRSKHCYGLWGSGTQAFPPAWEVLQRGVDGAPEQHTVQYAGEMRRAQWLSVSRKASASVAAVEPKLRSIASVAPSKLLARCVIAALHCVRLARCCRIRVQTLPFSQHWLIVGGIVV